MSEPRTTELSEPFAERVSRLFRELERAIRWNRPAILLAIYSSEFVREDAEAALSARLREVAQTLTSYRVTGEADADIPLHLVEHPDRARTVFFVSGLRWGGGPDGRNAYRALNTRREYFVDERIRAVFWLTESEAIALPSYAPDFWAFRHRVVEFVEPPKVEQISGIERELTRRNLEDHTLRKDTDAKIELREALLRDLPEHSETLAVRAELLYALAGLYRAKGVHARSLALYQDVLTIAQKLKDLRLQARCYTGLGNVYRDQGHINEAIAAYQSAIALDPSDSYPHNALGNVYADQGRMEEAITAYQQAIALDPNDVYPYTGLGNVYADQGRMEEAIAAYQQAIALDPNDVYPYTGLGNVYADLGLLEEAITAYQRAIALDPNVATPYNNLGSTYRDLGHMEDAVTAYQRAIALDPNDAHPYAGLGAVYASQGRIEEAIAICKHAIDLEPSHVRARLSLASYYRKLGRETDSARQLAFVKPLIKQANAYNRARFEAIQGNADKTLALLKTALERHQVSPSWVRRTLDFDFIRDDPRFKALVGE